MNAVDYAELLEDETIGPASRTLFESEYRRALKREEMHARISEDVRQQTATYKWQQETLRVASVLLALQFEVDAWEQRKRKPFCYGGTYSRMRSKGLGFRKRLARARKDAAEGSIHQQKWMEDHAEILAAVCRCGLPT